MSDFKITDIAAKLGKSKEEVTKEANDKGLKIDEGGSVSEADAKLLGADPKLLKLDKRQEMLKKAMERHKRHPRTREVKVRGGEGDSGQARKVSKEELLNRKKALEKSIQKVDEQRENFKSAAEDEVIEQVKETAPVQEAPRTEQVEKTVEKEAVKKPAAKQTAEDTRVEEVKSEKPKPEPVQKLETEEKKETAPASEKDEKVQDRAAAQSQDQQNARPQRQQQRTGDNRRNNQGRDNRIRDTRGNDNRIRDTRGNDNRIRDTRGNDNRIRDTRGNDNRIRDTRGNDNRIRDTRGNDNRIRDTRGNYQGRDGRPGDNRIRDTRGNYQGRDDNRRPQQDGRDGRGGYQGRDDNRRGQQDGRGGYQGRDDRRQGGRPDDRRQGGRPGGPGGGRPGGPRPGASLDPIADAKKLIRPTKEKEKQKEQEKEAKKKKAPAAAKKEKSFHKVIDEGFDELSLEMQIVKGEYKEEAPVTEEVETTDTPVEKKTQKPTSYKSKGRKSKRDKKAEEPRPIVRPSSIQIGENIVVGELAKLMGVKATEIIKELMKLGVMAAVTQVIDAETAQLICTEYGIEAQVKTVTEDDIIPAIEETDDDFVPRPPIVTVMGHVDHGKTSLLDAIRKTSVAEREAGGITQHIGAYEVEIDHGKIVFLDTPGHEAFTSLRARGAQVTDICILLVAADDGVMPQTKEAIEHVKAAGVKMIVAINKIDKPNANVDMVRSQLAELEVMSEEWGGEYQFQEISAKAGIGIDDMLERILLEAEMLELKGNPERLAEGIVIESKLDKQKGPVATILVQKGTLNKGDNFVVGSEFGKVRAMFNYKGMSTKSAGLSIPVEIMGFSGVPESGDKFIVTPDEKTAKQVAELRAEKKREEALLEKTKVSLADLFDRIKEGDLQELNIVLKADVQGSLEALKSSLLKLSNPEIKINILSSNVGGISENDIILAAASNALVFGFNVRPDAKAKAKADTEGVDINLYSVIYQIIDDVKQAMEGMLTPETKEEVIGKVEIRQVFSVPKIGKIGGSYVLEGRVTRNSHVRVIRDSIVIYDGMLSSLKRFQDDAKEVAAGYECGVGIEKYNDIKEGDILEAYQLVEEKRTLEDVEKDARAAEKKASE